MRCRVVVDEAPIRARDGSALPKQKHHLVAQMRDSFAKRGRELPEDLEGLVESAIGKHGWGSRRSAVGLVRARARC